MSKQKTTSNDALLSADVDQATMDAFDLSPHLIRLMWDEPFFATIMRVIKKRETKQIPTAGVYCKDGELKHITLSSNIRLLELKSLTSYGIMLPILQSTHSS